MLTFVRGSFFQMGGRFLLDGRAINVSAWVRLRVALTSWNGTRPFAELETEWVDPDNGLIRVWATDTAEWPVGRARIDAHVRDGYGRDYFAVCDWLRIVESMLNEAPDVIPEVAPGTAGGADSGAAP